MAALAIDLDIACRPVIGVPTSQAKIASSFANSLTSPLGARYMSPQQFDDQHIRPRSPLGVHSKRSTILCAHAWLYHHLMMSPSTATRTARHRITARRRQFGSGCLSLDMRALGL
jgi:hypothetical protein